MFSCFRIFTVGVLIAVAFAQGQAAEQNPTLQVAVGWNKPPYVIQETMTGYEVELVRQVLVDMGYGANFVAIPYGRSYEIISDSEFDAVLTLSNKVEMSDTYLSDEYIYYQNVAISLTSENIKLEKIRDLTNVSIVAFQNAQRVLGDEFAAVAKQNLSYFEIPDQFRQLQILFAKRTQVIVMDLHIFRHFKEQMGDAVKQIAVNFHPLFPVNGYRVGFRQSALRDKFNLHLSSFLGSEQHAKLKQTYPFFD